MTDHLSIKKTGALLKVLRYLMRMLLKGLTYFTKQSRFDRAQMRKAFSGKSVEDSKKAVAAYWEAKRKSGRLRVKQGGVIHAPPFPAHGSLLTEEERNDPMGSN